MDVDDETVEDRLTVFNALATDHRLRILEALGDGEMLTCELQVVLDAPQSTVASHLRERTEAGLVRKRREGTWTVYRIGGHRSHAVAVARDGPPSG